MKHLIYTLATIVFLSSCTRNTYVDKSADVQGQTFAILPFDVRIEKDINFKKTTQAQLDEKARVEAYQYQNATYQYMLGKQKDFIVAFQDPDETNTMLKRAGITGDKVGNYTKAELAKVLKVDGIMSGKVYRKEVMSQSLGKGIDLFAKTTNLAATSVKTNEANLSLSLYSSPDKRVVWTYQYDLSGTSDNSPDAVTASLMNDAARKFPYRKHK
jgi:hypothetical protein